MKVRIYCERSGIIREAFRALGHDAISIDLEPAEDGSPHHIQADALEVLKVEKSDLDIAHPECRRLANSGVLRLYKGGKFANGVDWEKWQEMERAALFFRQFFVLSKAKRLCVENSIQHGHALEAHGCGKPNQIIQPYNFGADASKSTALWLRGLPQLKPTQYIKPRMVCKECGWSCGYEDAFKERGCPACDAMFNQLLPRWSNQTDSGQNKLTPSPTRSMDRARTYPGIAKAMAEQWTK